MAKAQKKYSEHLTIIISVRTRDGICRGFVKSERMARERERESRNSVLPAHLDDATERVE